MIWLLLQVAVVCSGWLPSDAPPTSSGMCGSGPPVVARPMVQAAPTPYSLVPTLQWDQLIDAGADVTGLVYRYYLDGASVGTVLTATCREVASSELPLRQLACDAPLPETGQHAVQLTAERHGLRSGFSTPALVFLFEPSGLAPPESVTLEGVVP